jgi:hypothetical protein
MVMHFCTDDDCTHCKIEQLQEENDKLQSKLNRLILEADCPPDKTHRCPPVPVGSTDVEQCVACWNLWLDDKIDKA